MVAVKNRMTSTETGRLRQTVHREEPRTDLDMASYGVIALLDENGARWRPKKSFHALADLYA